jgi:DHA1 family bicyclomycin/chloramphenicol resistance-like MFS transporter
MYLPSLPMLEREFSASTADVQRTLATFFLGFALGQTLYGPVADRFGRKPPLYASLVLFCGASLACAWATSVNALAAFRFFQAVGACGGAVIARAMVRDLYPPLEMRRALSTLMMVNACAPVIAPVIGGLLLVWFGWSAAFWTLASVAALGVVVTRFRLPESLNPSHVQPLHLTHIFSSYGRLLRDRSFLGATLVTGFSFGGLFAYIAGAPFVFQQIYGRSPQQFSLIFASNAFGIIASSVINGRFLHRLPPERILWTANWIQFSAGVLLFLAVVTGTGGMYSVWAMLFCYVACVGLTFPNGSAIALAGYPTIAGTASSLIGTSQFVLGALSTLTVGAIQSATALPMGLMVAICATLALLMNVLVLRRRTAQA